MSIRIKYDLHGGVIVDAASVQCPQRYECFINNYLQKESQVYRAPAVDEQKRRSALVCQLICIYVLITEVQN